MYDESLSLEVDAPRGGSASIGCGGDIYWAGGVVAAKRKVADQAAIEIEVGSESATAMSARAKSGGKVFPRFSARRRIPRQARELKKNRCGSSPVSKMSDNEDATPSLGYSELLSIQDSP